VTDSADARIFSNIIVNTKKIEIVLALISGPFIDEKKTEVKKILCYCPFREGVYCSLDLLRLSARRVNTLAETVREEEKLLSLQ
jgi:hypothetical protein